MSVWIATDLCFEAFAVCVGCPLPCASSHTCSRACIHVHMYICYTHYTHTKYPFSLFISCLLCVRARVRVYTYIYVIYTHTYAFSYTCVLCMHHVFIMRLCNAGGHLASCAPSGGAEGTARANRGNMLDCSDIQVNTLLSLVMMYMHTR